MDFDEMPASAPHQETQYLETEGKTKEKGYQGKV